MRNGDTDSVGRAVILFFSIFNVLDIVKDCWRIYFLGFSCIKQL